MDLLVQLEDVGRSFGATRALDRVSLDLRAGEVHALVGENGAGKSTLMNILSGVIRPDAGSIRLQGVPVRFRSTHHSRDMGIATVFQELSLVPGLDVAENICAGHAPTRFGLLDRRAMRRRAVAALGRLRLTLAPGARVENLLASQRQGVEIAKALDLLLHPARADLARVLILDEPTSALNTTEKQALFASVRALRADGVGIIYISHHLDEVLALADRITVLRDGSSVWTRDAAGLAREDLVSAMVGREIRRSDRLPARPGPVRASLRGVGIAGQVQGINLDLHAGEVLAVAGLDGSGREQVARLLAGLMRPDRGQVELLGKVHPGSLRAAMDRGLAYVPDDRKMLGLFLDLSLAANAVAADLGQVSRAGLVRETVLRAAGEETIRRLGVRAPHAQVRIGALSGGNQQKVLLAKWLRRSPQILIVEEPTKGVDIGAKRDIHAEIRALAQQGAAVLVASSDLPEVLELADRIVVLHWGQVAGELAAAGATEQAVMALAAGSAGPQREKIEA